MMKIKSLLTILLMAFSMMSAFAQRFEMDISGQWNTPLGVCTLPGTTDSNRLGDGKHATNVTTQLTRLFPYEGKLDYERTVNITEEMAKKHLTLYLERTKPSILWIDGDSIGAIGHLHAPHVYPLPKLSAKEHTIKLRIDNRPEAVPQGVHGSHAWTDATQTNWNGIIGKMAIVGTDNTYILRTNVYPQYKEKTAEIRMQIVSDRKMNAMLSFHYDNYPPIKMNVKLSKGLNEISHVMNLGKT